MGQYTVKARSSAGETEASCKVRIGDWPVESYEDPFVKLNIIEVTTSDSGSDTEDDIVESTKKKLAQLIEEEPDLSIIEEEDHSEPHSSEMITGSVNTSEEESYAPRIEIVPDDPVRVKEGETIRLATKVTGQRLSQVMVLLPPAMVLFLQARNSLAMDTVRIFRSLFIMRFAFICFCIHPQLQNCFSSFTILNIGLCHYRNHWRPELF